MDVPLGRGTLSFDLPDCEVTTLVRPGGPTVDPREAAETAVDDPHGPALSDLVDPSDAVAVVVTDVTRATPDDVLLDVLIDRLPTDDVSVVLGLGLHRPMTDEEIREALGDRAPLAENHDPEATVRVGTVEAPPATDPRADAPVDELGTCPVEVNRTVADADVVLSTGMVEPHQYAGFSGGAKTVVIGAGSESIIRYTHGPAMLSRPGVRLGRVEGNPFRATLDRAGDIAGPDFCVNVTKGPEGILGVGAGRPRATVRELAGTARAALSAPVPVPAGADAPTGDGTGGAGESDPAEGGGFDAVVAGVGAPKDANLYQASRAATYLLLGDFNPLRPGGRVVVPARLGEGAGEGRGERRFYERLRGATDAESLYEEMRGGYEPGAQRAFVLARALGQHDVYVTNSERPDVVEECLMHARESVEEAIEPGSRVLVVPDALNTLVTAPKDAT